MTTTRIVAGFLLILSVASPRSWGQDAEGPFPKFKDGVAMPPPGAVFGAPFDVVKAFAAPPLGQNAAPLYLDALYEFGSEMRSCFPEGPENDARFLAIKARNKQESDIEQAFFRDPKSVPVAEVDAVIAHYQEGFRKLAEAQIRERCVFQTGVGFTALLPHAQTARMVARVAQMKVKREIDKGELDAAIADVRIVLRLTRDLQIRGYLISQLVAGAMTTVVANRMVEPILAAPGLTVAQCDSLMAVLDEYEVKSVDPYEESLSMEYVGVRVTLWDLILHQAKLGKSMGVKPGASVVKTLIEPMLETTFRKGEAPPAAKAKFPDDIDEMIARTTPEELDKVIGRINTYYDTLLALKGRTRLEQMEMMPKPEEFFQGDDSLTMIVRAVQPSTQNLAPVFGRLESNFRSSEALTAIRRWQLTHDGASPTDLGAASKAAGLHAAPRDPFDGKPFRLVIIDGQPVVYSIGKDGRDDGGKIDSDFERKPGDLTYRLAAKK